MPAGNVEGSLGCAGRGALATVFVGDRPGSGLLLVADGTVGVGQADIDRLEVMPLEEGGHRRPGARRGSALRDVLADTAHGQSRDGHW